jgi:hypothetical protein
VPAPTWITILGQLLTGLDRGVDRPAKDARIVPFSVADQAGFVDLLAGQADVGGRLLWVF